MRTNTIPEHTKLSRVFTIIYGGKLEDLFGCSLRWKAVLTATHLHNPESREGAAIRTAGGQNT